MQFQYLASDKKGKRIRSITTAENVSALVARLRMEGLLPLKIHEVKSSSLRSRIPVFSRVGKVKAKEIVVFTRQLAAMLNAGLLLTEALETIVNDLENAYFQRMVQDIIKEVRGGKDLSEALRRYPKTFPVIYAAIVKSGEATGNLARTLLNLAQYLEKSQRLKEKVKGALTYPGFIFCFASFVIILMIEFLVPKFKEMYSEMGSALPWLTRVVINLSESILHHLFFLILIGVALGFLFSRLLKIPQFRFWIDSVKLKLPIVGKEIIHKELVSRFCRTLGFLLSGEAGLSLSLDIASQVTGHLGMAKAIRQVNQGVVSGASLSEEIRKHDIFPRLVPKMVAVGEKTGRVDEMLNRTADYYDEELETTTQSLVTLIEPALVIFIGFIVMFVVVALYLPVFKMSTLVK